MVLGILYTLQHLILKSLEDPHIIDTDTIAQDTYASSPWLYSWQVEK